jgi:hypothetical protein
MSINPQNPLPYDRPATYQISVMGRLDPNWSKRLDGMRITSTQEGSNPVITTLEGEVTDQAALAGILNMLYELHMPILSLKWLNIW